MQKTLFLFFQLSCVCLISLASQCECGNYKTILVTTSWGQEEIPCSCSSWSDGCNVYCRTDSISGKGYTSHPIPNKICKKDDIARSICVDNDVEMHKLCDKK